MARKMPKANSAKLQARHEAAVEAERLRILRIYYEANASYIAAIALATGEESK